MMEFAGISQRVCDVTKTKANVAMNFGTILSPPARLSFLLCNLKIFVEELANFQFLLKTHRMFQNLTNRASNIAQRS